MPRKTAEKSVPAPATFTGGALTTATSTALDAGLGSIVSEAGAAGGGDPILKMDRGGEWTIGRTREEVQAGSRWIINPHYVLHGYVAFSDAKKLLDQKMRNASAGEPLPTRDELNPDHLEHYQPAFELQLRCVHGDDEGMQVRYPASTFGGKSLVGVIIGKIQARRKAGKADYVPIIELDHENYNHSEWGKIANPLFNVMGWTTMGEGASAETEAEPAAAGGNGAAEPEKETVPEEKAPPKRRRRAAAPPA